MDIWPGVILLEFRHWFETSLGDELYKQKGIWMIPFADVDQDTVEGYYFDYGKHHTGGSISDLSKVQVGDKVADHSLNMTPYWTVSHVDEQKQIIYLDPIDPNPLKTGVGAGGKKIDKHDIKVLSGEYEDERTESILKQWKTGRIHDIPDVAYLLMGTVPLQFGPNGAQGGWYTSSDTHATRGGKKGMSPGEVQKQDANTLKNTFGFGVPEKALKGELNPRVWDDFVNGQVQDEHLEDTKLTGENFSDPKAMAKMVLEHPQPTIKRRNAEALIDMYQGHQRYRKEQHKLYQKPNYEYEKYKDQHKAMDDKWQKGDFSDPKILPLIHQTGLELSKVFVGNRPGMAGNYHDPYYFTKEKFINLAKDQGWDDVIEAYEKTPDRDNRQRVFDIYVDRKDKAKVFRMLDRETSAENIRNFLELIQSGLGYAEAVNYGKKNYDSLVKRAQAAPDGKWYAEKLITWLQTMRDHKPGLGID